jgi:hypothetical protein
MPIYSKAPVYNYCGAFKLTIQNIGYIGWMRIFAPGQ